MSAIGGVVFDARMAKVEYAFMPTCVHACMHACMHTYIHTLDMRFVCFIVYLVRCVLGVEKLFKRHWLWRGHRAL